MASQVGFGPRAVVWRTLKRLNGCGDTTHRGVTRGKRGHNFPGDESRQGAPNHYGDAK